MNIEEVMQTAKQQHRQGRFADAEKAYRAVLAQDPNHAEASQLLGVIARQFGQPDVAMQLIQRSITLNPNEAYYYNNLGNVFTDLGQLDKAITAYWYTLQLDPNYTQAFSNLLFSLIFNAAYDGPATRKVCDQWQHSQAERFEKAIKPHGNNRSPERRLRVGYLSHHFADHCQSFFTIPLLGHHDRKWFEVFCYAAAPNQDATTARIQKLADVWRPIAALNDDQAADLIRQDQIDILIDLSMHMTGNRIFIFARKPAPVQIAWLAYPGTTGLPAIDYRITDPYLDPPGEHDDWYVEKSLRLPETFWCYDPLVADIPVSPLPALANGYITFGCLNNVVKVNDETLKLWAGVLNAVPGSKMLLLVPPGSPRKRVQDVLASQGIASERLELVARMLRRDYLAAHQRMDIGLDPHPCPGHTSTLDALWMGVPVVNLPGPTAVGRGGISILTNAGLPELIARDREDYIRIATALAADLPKLAALRESLRPRLEKSPLMDAPRFAKNMETAYRAVWREWCKK